MKLVSNKLCFSLIYLIEASIQQTLTRKGPIRLKNISCSFLSASKKFPTETSTSCFFIRHLNQWRNFTLMTITHTSYHEKYLWHWLVQPHVNLNQEIKSIFRRNKPASTVNWLEKSSVGRIWWQLPRKLRRQHFFRIAFLTSIKSKSACWSCLYDGSKLMFANMPISIAVIRTLDNWVKDCQTANVKGWSWRNNHLWWIEWVIDSTTKNPSRSSSTSLKFASSHHQPLQ